MKKFVSIFLALAFIMMSCGVSFAETTDLRLTSIHSAENYINKGDLVSAEKEIKKILAQNANDQLAIRILARINRRQFEITKQRNFLDLAKAEIEKSSMLSPNDLYGNVEAALIYYDLNDKAKAMKAIDFAIMKDPQNNAWKKIKAQIQSMR